MRKDFQEIALGEVKYFLAPLMAAAESEQNFMWFLSQLGWDVSLLPPNVVSGLRGLFETINSASSDIPTNPSSLKEVLHAINLVSQLVRKVDQAIDILAAFPLEPSPDVKELLTDLTSLLTVGYIYNRLPRLLYIFSLLDIVIYPKRSAVPMEDENQQMVWFPTNLLRIDFNRAIRLFRNPVATLRDVYLPNGTFAFADAAAAQEFSDRLFPRFAAFLSTFGFRCSYGLTEADRDGFDDDITFQRGNRTLSIISPGNQAKLDALVIPESEGGSALEVAISGVVDMVRMAKRWRLEVEAGGTLPSLLINSEGITLPSGVERAHIRSSAQQLGSSSESGLLFGSRSGTRFEVGLFRVDAHFDSYGPDFGLGFFAGNCKFVLDTSNADGFLQEVLPDDGVQVGFDFSLTWSQLYGFKVCGNLGLEIDLPLNISSSNLVEIKSLYLALLGEYGSLSVAVGLSASLYLGPVSALVQKVGLKATKLFDSDFDESFHFGFIPPSRIGLSIDANGIIGGGFLEFDDTNERYTGILDLSFSEIGLTAIGLITTRMPDGSPGFAMLISIGVEFRPPIQLAFGFTLSAVGGLIGINRTMAVDVLRAGIRNRTLDSILFPEDPIQNVSTIISNLRSVFPPQEGRFIVGPMVRIAWGSPNLIQANIGIIIELPDPVRLVILGQLAALLPNEKTPLVEIHLDVLGVIDFAKKSLSIDATLYDSRILEFALTGDAALRLTWGDNPQFALSLGGFHPSFSPPPKFPELRRLKLALSSGRKLQLSCQVYQALTSNTLQFGARADLFARVSKARVEGHLSFDALFHFSPFSFEVRIGASVVVKVSGRTLAGISISIVLSGPTPWHVKGKAKIKILFFSITVRLNVSWGRSQRATLPAEDPWGHLKEALLRPESWGSVLPSTSHMVESLHLLDANNRQQGLVMHPAGTLEVRENVLPLGVRLEKLGHAPVTHHYTFDIVSIQVGQDENENLDTLLEYFARGHFEELTESEKLSLPSFEKMPGGVAYTSDRLVFGTSIERYQLTYESILIQDDGISEKNKKDATIHWNIAKQQLRSNAARRSPLRTTGQQKYERPGQTSKVGIDEEGYTIVYISDLTAVPLDENYPPNDGTMTRMKADQVRKVYIQEHPEHEDDIQVVSAFEVPA